MTLYSLRLLQHPVTRDFFAETVETSLPPFPRESMIGLEVTFDFEGVREQEKLLLLPLGIVSGLFIGSVVGEPHSLIKASRGQGPWLSSPSCRRFALDLEKQELLEVSWYLDRKILLVNWVHFPTESHCLSYFVVYEAPVPGKLPHKLYKSVEMISCFDPLVESDSNCSNWLDISSKSTCSLVCSVPEVRLFFQRIVAAKSGIIRTTEYVGAGNNVSVDHLARFHSCVRALKDSELTCFPSLTKIRTCHQVTQLPFIETENALEGIHQLLYGQQQTNMREYPPRNNRRKARDELFCNKCQLSNKNSVDWKQFQLDGQLHKHSGNSSLQDAHTPTWIDSWNSMSSEGDYSGQKYYPSL